MQKGQICGDAGCLATSAAHRFSPTNRFRNVPMPVMSISTTSPALRSGDAPSVPIQITSPGHSVKYFVSSTMNGLMPKIMSLVRKRLLSLPFTFTMVSILSRSTSVSIQGPIGLLPGALADVVADSVAEYARHRVGLVEVFCFLADDDDQLALIVDFFGGG